MASRGELEEDSLKGGGDKETKGEMWEMDRKTGTEGTPRCISGGLGRIGVVGICTDCGGMREGI